MAVAITGCGQQTGRDEVSTDTADDAASPRTESDLESFCDAVAVMDAHDGTTDASVAVSAIDELRESAPSAIREDVELLADTLIVNNYPSHAEPSMKAAPSDQADPAGARLADYVETNCGPDG